MRDWLTVIIVLLIIGIVFDGIRRMRIYRRDSLRMSRKLPDTEDIPEAPSSSEFPSGGARVAGYRDPDELSNVNKNLKQTYVESRKTRGAPARSPEQGSLKFDIPVPMLMESVTDKDEADDKPINRDLEPSIGALDDLDEDDSKNIDSSQREEEYAGAEEDSSSLEDLDHEPVSPYQSPLDEGRTKEQEKQKAASSSKTDSSPKKQTSTAKKDSSDKKRESAKEQSQPDPERIPDEVLVISVMAKKGELFAGNDLLRAMVAVGLRYGDMDIFHRYETEDGTGPIYFSLANMVVPGTFDLSAMDEFETPGVSLFLSLPVQGDSLTVYELMVETAQSLAEQLNGELKDENRSVMTRQTIEHGRQRVVEYERKRRLAKA